MSKPRLTETDYENASINLGCEVEAIKAVSQTESAGDGFDEFDRPKVLFERHKFHQYTRGRFDKSHPDLSNPVPGGYGAGGAHQYERFSRAFELDPIAAMMATSWGKFQILGANFAICGYRTVGEFVDAMKEGEGQQLDAFCQFIIHNHLDDELTSHNWAAFAKGYNGGNYRINHYDTKMAAAYKYFKAQRHIPNSAAAAPFDAPAIFPPDPPSETDTPANDGAGQTTEPPIQQPPTNQPVPLASTAVEPSFVQQVTTTITTKLTAITTFIGGLGALGTALMDKAGDFASRNAAYIAGIALVGLAIWYLKTRQDKAHALQLALIDKAANPTASTVTITK